ncbi:MAG: [protein-PII] uridylyltransferase, partial [Gammaproteobacteria bacterium]|nr:[protein-PII] uridylyltransferase [Gammaproteobacteria bacterium]
MKYSPTGAMMTSLELVSPDLAALTDAVSGSKTPLPLLKAALADFRAHQHTDFANGTSVTQLITARAAFIDHILSLCWQRFSWDENLSSLRKSRISLVAVGGYGRRELLPNSDIDLLILIERANAQHHSSNIQSFLALLWDIGLEVGHSVRSVKESLHQAAHDVTIMTALLDARAICGAPYLLQQLRLKLRSKTGWKTKSFFQAKYAEQQDRHAKSNHTEYSLEPNLKTAPGGLRDIQTILWIAQFHHQTSALNALVDEKFLELEEANKILDAREFLWKIRFVLHDLLERDENRLFFDNQKKVAFALGYRDDAQLAVEQFMQDYYRFAKSVSTINEIILQDFDEQVVQGGRRAKPIKINERFQTNNHYLEVTQPDIFERNPEALLEMFVILGETPELKGIRASTIRQAQTSAARIDDAFRQSELATTLFLNLLRVEHHLFSQLRRMNRYGILGAYLP